MFVQAVFPLPTKHRRAHRGDCVNQLTHTDHTDEHLLIAHGAFPSNHRMGFRLRFEQGKEALGIEQESQEWGLLSQTRRSARTAAHRRFERFTADGVRAKIIDHIHFALGAQ